MPIWKRLWFRVLVAIVLALGGAYWWLMLESHTPFSGSYVLNIQEIRRLAKSLPGDLPSEIRVEKVANFGLPAAFVMAGENWTPQDSPAASYQLVYPDRTVVVDTAMDEPTSKAMGGVARFDSAAYLRMTKAMGQASLIVITHEHPDHAGGLGAFPDLARVLKVTKLNREQVENLGRMKPAIFPAGALDGYQPFDYQAMAAVAPGVVLIKSPGHTPGSQLVYVQRADGTEILFLGDVAWQIRNVEHVRERPRLFTLIMQEDRTKVLWELTALHNLAAAEPRIHLIPGHDGEVLAKLIQQKVLIPQFK